MTRPLRPHDARQTSARRTVRRLTALTLAGGAAAAAYMAFEAQWIRCRRVDLPVPRLPPAWSGLTILHLADVHAGTFPTNERSLRKAVEWAASLEPDLVLLTGDILGDSEPSRASLDLLARLRPPLGKFAVTGNHEYGLGKSPLAHTRETGQLWEQAGITLLSDRCVALPPRDGSTIVLCGADHLTGGYGLDPSALFPSAAEEPPSEQPPQPWTPFGPRPTPSSPATASSTPPSPPGRGDGAQATPETFPILLIHAPPPDDSPLRLRFGLTFAGHTHGGQLRLPTREGLMPLHREPERRLGGVYPWGQGVLVVSRGVGTSFLPFRLLTRPEATISRLLYTSRGETLDTRL